MNAQRLRITALTFLLVTLTTCGIGCDNWLREASYVIGDVADVIDNIADDWDHDRHCRHDCGNTIDDILDDIEDWFD